MKQNKNYSEEDLQNLLQNMPEVEDNQSADELYEKISSRINTPEPEKVPFYKQPWLVTSFSAAAILIVLIAAVTWLSNGTYDTANEGDNADSAESSSESADIQKDQEKKEFSSNGSDDSNANTESNSSDGGAPSEDQAGTFSDSKENNKQNNSQDSGSSNSTSNKADIQSSEPEEEGRTGDSSKEKQNAQGDKDTLKSPDDSSSEDANIASSEESEKRMTSLGGPENAQSRYASYIRSGTQFVTISLAGDNADTIVPVSFVVPPNWGTLEEAYNSIAKSIKAKEWGLQDYYFKGVTFDIQKDQKQVIAQFPKEFKSPTSSTEVRMLLDTLKEMFRAHGIETIKLIKGGKKGLPLGPNGVKEEVTLQDQAPSAYLLYQNGEQKKGFLTPVSLDSKSVNEAMKVMQEGTSAKLLSPVIPKDVSYKIKKKGNTLQIFFNEGASFGEKPLGMVEAILMTAKSFGFSEVKFVNPPKLERRVYNLDQPVPVPDLINPKPFDLPKGTETP